MLKLKLSLILTLTVGLVGCARDTVTSDKIAAAPSPQGENLRHQPEGARGNNIRRNYTLIYSEGERRMTFLATFYMAGTWNTTVKLVAPAQLVVEGRHVDGRELMSRDSALVAGLLLPILSPFFALATGTNYVAQLPRSSSSPVHIEWTDQVGQIFRDRLTMQVVSVQAPSVANRGQGLKVTVHSSLPGELSAELRRPDSVPTEPNVQQRSSIRTYGQGSVFFSANDLSQLSPGRATLNVEHRVDVPVDQRGGNRGSASTVYRLTPVMIDLF